MTLTGINFGIADIEFSDTDLENLFAYILSDGQLAKCVDLSVYYNLPDIPYVLYKTIRDFSKEDSDKVFNTQELIDLRDKLNELI